MKKAITLILLIFVVNLSSNETLYFNCEALELSSIGKKIEYYTYKKGEKVHSLSINKRENLVSWRRNTFEFTEDYNKDNIYEFDKYTGPHTIRIRFNGVTGRLEDQRGYKLTDGSRQSDTTEYQCKKTEPIFN